MITGRQRFISGGFERKGCEDLIVLLMIQNKEVNQSLENQLKELDSWIEIQNYLCPAWMRIPGKEKYFRRLKNCLKAELLPGRQPLKRLDKDYRILGGLEKMNKT